MYFKKQCIDDKLLFPLRLDRNRLYRCELHDLSLKIFHLLYIRRIFCSNARVDNFSFLIYQFLHSLHLLYNEPSKVQRQLRAVLEILYAVKLPPLTQREKRYKTLLGLGSIPTKTKESSEVCEDSNSFLFLYDYLFPFLWQSFRHPESDLLPCSILFSHWRIIESFNCWLGSCCTLSAFWSNSSISILDLSPFLLFFTDSLLSLFHWKFLLQFSVPNFPDNRHPIAFDSQNNLKEIPFLPKQRAFACFAKHNIPLFLHISFQYAHLGTALARCSRESMAFW